MLCLCILTGSSYVVDRGMMKQLVKIVLELNENVKVLTSAVHASLKESSVIEFEVPEEIKFPLDSEADLNDTEELLLSNSFLHFKLVSCVVTGLSKLLDMLY